MNSQSYCFLFSCALVLWVSSYSQANGWSGYNTWTSMGECIPQLNSSSGESAKKKEARQRQIEEHLRGKTITAKSGFNTVTGVVVAVGTDRRNHLVPVTLKTEYGRRPTVYLSESDCLKY